MPWRQVTGMRNFLIHTYDQVDLSRVWHTAVTDIPNLVEYLQPFLPIDQDGARGDGMG